MLVANVMAHLDQIRNDLEAKEKDLKSMDKIIKSLQDRRAYILKDIEALECKIIELEDELDG